MKKNINTLSKVIQLTLIIAAMFTMLTCSTEGDNATISISLGDGNAKSALNVSISELRHVVVLNGPTGKKTLSISGSGSAKTSVAPGTWRIDVQGFYGGDLYSTGSASASVRAGQTANVTVNMNVVWSEPGGTSGVEGGGIVTSPIRIDHRVATWKELEDVILIDIHNLLLASPSISNQNILITSPLSAGETTGLSIAIPPGVEVTLITPSGGMIISRDIPTTFDLYMFEVYGTLNLGHESYLENSKLTLDGSGGTSSNLSLIHIDGGTLNMYEGVTLQNNECTAWDGGAVYNSTGNSVFNMKGGKINGNTALNGGGVYLTGSGNNLYIGGNAIIDSNYAIDTGSWSYGGGVYFTGAQMKMEDSSKITNNKIHGDMPGSSRATVVNGGGIYVGQGSLEIGGDAQISHNIAEGATSSAGGGVYWVGSGSDSLSITGNTQISYNKAQDAAVNIGGGIFASVGTGSPTVEIDLTVAGGIHNNEAIGTGASVNSMGGGVYLNGISGTFKIKGSTKIYLNTSDGTTQGFGGGVYANCSLTIEGATEITSNTAKGNAAHGGGVYVNNSVTMDNGLISNNSTIGPIGDSKGGGVYVFGTFSKTGPGIIDGSGGTDYTKNRALDPAGTAFVPDGNDPGHAVYVDDASARGLNGSAPNGHYLDSTDSSNGSNGGPWDF